MSCVLLPGISGRGDGHDAEIAGVGDGDELDVWIGVFGVVFELGLVLLEAGVADFDGAGEGLVGGFELGELGFLGETGDFFDGSDLCLELGSEGGEEEQGREGKSHGEALNIKGEAAEWGGAAKKRYGFMKRFWCAGKTRWEYRFAWLAGLTCEDVFWLLALGGSTGTVGHAKADRYFWRQLQSPGDPPCRHRRATGAGF